MGLDELATDAAAEYHALALALAQDADRLKELRTRLVTQVAKFPLFNTQATTRKIEAAYEQMASYYDSGKSPITFSVPG